MGKQVRVLVVDDSALMRRLISDLLLSDPEIDVVGQAKDGLDALAKLAALKPDVITLDVEMPVLDGMETLKRIMKDQPTPVVMLSSLTQAGADTTMQCLRLGAVDFVAKPSGTISADMRRVAQEITEKIKMASGTVSTKKARPEDAASTNSIAAGHTKLSLSLPELQSTFNELAFQPKAEILLIGASTGGPKALHYLIPKLPPHFGVPTIIVQHLPSMFTRMMALQLQKETDLTVREAEEGDRLYAGTILVAPGGRHLTLDGRGFVRLTDDPPLHGVRPAIDVTLASLIGFYGSAIAAVLLTGMGKDGAMGLKTLHDLGGITVAEDHSTCVVYGMPKAAVELKGVTHLLPLTDIPGQIARTFAPCKIRAAC